MATVYQYKIYCETDKKPEFVWGTSPPTKCPIDTSHSVNLQSVTIVNEISESKMEIKEEDTPTGGHFACTTRKIDVQAGIFEQGFTFSYPINASVLNVLFTSSEEHQGDGLEVHIAPDTIIGITIANVGIGSNILIVSPTVLQYAECGYFIKLFNGLQMEDMGMVVSINKENNMLIMEKPSTKSFPAAATTYVMMTVKMVYDYHIGHPGTVIIGGNKIGASFIPANTTILVCYLNNTMTAKEFTMQVEFLY